jgi:DNA-directed RNA polymerase specialized sigma24 family protein
MSRKHWEREVNSSSLRAEQACRLVFEQQMTYEEAAHVMGITADTVEQHIMIALEALRAELTEWRTV